MKISKKEIMILLLIAVMIIMSFVWVYMMNKDKLGEVVVEYKGEILITAPLSQNREIIFENGRILNEDEEVSAPTKEPGNMVNIIEIKDGEVRCVFANCQNQICVHTLALDDSADGRIIACLPHELAIYIK